MADFIRFWQKPKQNNKLKVKKNIFLKRIYGKIVLVLTPLE